MHGPLLQLVGPRGDSGTRHSTVVPFGSLELTEQVPPRFSALVDMLRIPLPADSPSPMPAPSSMSVNESHSPSTVTTASIFDACACRSTLERLSPNTWRRCSRTI